MADPIEYDELARYLRILGAPGRLELLRKLQVPRSVGEIELAATRRDRARQTGRLVTRATVAAHLRRLEDAGLVVSRPSTRDGQPVVEHKVNQARLFVVLDELRRVGLLRSLDMSDTAIEDLAEVAPPQLPDGAALVVVGGPLEGRVFALKGAGPWTIGRDPRADAALPHDPFVSRENTRIERAGRALRATALPDAANGTLVNWRPLVPGEPAPLAPGDIIGVGRSLLVVRGDAP